MTIGISALCTLKAPQDCFILASDKLGSFGDEFSTRRHAKMFVQGEHDCCFAVCAGSVENAGELVGKIVLEWRKLPERYYGGLRAGLQEAVNQYKKYRFVMDVLPRYALGLNEDWRLLAEQLGITQELLKSWNEFDIGCELLVGTFASTGQAHVYSISSLAEIESLTAPGFSAIGSGASNAMFWLAYREQASGMSLLRSAYHVYEAKLMAEQSAHVGIDDIEMLIATPTMWYKMSDKAPTSEGCPISLTQIKELWNKFGPSTTESLGGL